ncbi:MAG: HIT family protein [Anaerolineales bacterium]
MKQLWAPWRMSYLQGEGRDEVEGCLFCAKLEQPDEGEHILYRGLRSYVTLNRYPYNNGHLMVVPCEHVPGLEDLDAGTLLETLRLVQESLRILREVFAPEGFNVGINEGVAAGAGVAEHLHVHVVPRWSHDANYMTTIGQTRVIPEMLDETYTALRPHFARLGEADSNGL